MTSTLQDELRDVSGPLDEFRRGWMVLAACFLGVAISVPAIGGYLSGVFVQPLENEFGWSRAAIALHTLFSVGALALTAPLIGKIVDRIGVRPVILVSFILFAILQFAMGQFLDSLPFFYVLSVLIAVFAAGTTPVVFTRVINAWFDKSRGLALGITLLGTGATATIGPILLTDFVDSYGWRAGYQALAGVIIVGMVFVVPFVRDFPTVLTAGAGAGAHGSSKPQLSGLSLAEAVRSPAFALIVGAFVLVSLAVGGLLLHFIPMLTDYGLTRAEAAQMAALAGLSVLVGRIGTGILIDRYFAPYVALLMMLCAAIGYCALLFGGVEFAFITAIAVGFTIGAEIDLISYLAVRYFGLRNYGAIYGVLYGLAILSVGVAPYFTGLIFDGFGSYDYALMMSVIGLVCSSFVFAMMKPFPVFEKAPIEK